MRPTADANHSAEEKQMTGDQSFGQAEFDGTYMEVLHRSQDIVESQRQNLTMIANAFLATGQRETSMKLWAIAKDLQLAGRVIDAGCNKALDAHLGASSHVGLTLVKTALTAFDHQSAAASSEAVTATDGH